MSPASEARDRMTRETETVRAHQGPRRTLWHRLILPAIALLLTAGTYLASRQHSLDLEGGAALIRGFHAPSSQDGTTSRVVDDMAEVRLRGIGPYPAVVRISWSSEGIAWGSGLEASAGGPAVAERWRGSGFQELEVPNGALDDDDVVVILRPQPPGARVRVERISIDTGGVAAFTVPNWRPTRASLWRVVAILWLIGGVMALAAAGFRLVVDVGRMAEAVASVVAGGLTAFVLVLLRFDLSHLIGGASVLVGATSAAALVVSHPRVASRLMAFDHRVLAWHPRAWLFAVLALGLGVGVLGTGVLRGQVPSQADLLSEFYPWRAYGEKPFSRMNRAILDLPQQRYPGLMHAARAVRDGTLPLWSSDFYGGHPFLAASNLAPVFSPFTAIAYVLPLPHATVPMAFAVLLVSGLGMFVLVRSWGFGWPASTFAGVAYLLNPFTVLWLDFTQGAVAAWLPWLLWATERVIKRRQALDSAVLGAMVALLLVCGHPETAFKAFLLAGPYALVRTLHASRRGRALALVTVGYAGGLLLGAVQILPTLEYLQHSRQVMVRQSTEVNAHFPPFAAIVTAFVPKFLGSPADHTYVSVENRYGQPTTIFDHLVFPGGVTWLLAAVGVACAWQDRRVRLFSVAALMATAIMFAAPGLIGLLSAMPLLEFTALPRFGGITILCAIALAAFGVESLAGSRALPVHRPADHRGRTQVGCARKCLESIAAGGMAVLALTVIAIWCVAYDSWFQKSQYAALARRYSMFEAGILLVGLGLIISRARGRLAASAFVPAIVVLLAIDLLAFGKGFHATIPPERVFAPIPEIAALQADTDVFRVGGRRFTLLPNTATAYGLQDFRGYDGIGHLRYGALVDRSLDFDGFLRVPGRRAPDYSGRFESPRVLDLLNVKYVFVEPDYPLPAERYTRLHVGAAPLYRNERAFPRAFLVDAYRVVADDETMLRMIRRGDVDLRRTVLLESELPDALRPEAAPPGSRPGTATIRRYDDHVVEIETRAEGKRLLFLGDVHYPGWKAYVDERPTPIYRADYALRAVPVPAGLHLVRFAYEPLSFTVGAGLSLMAGIGFVMFAALGRDRRRTKSPGPTVSPGAEFGRRTTRWYGSA